MTSYCRSFLSISSETFLAQDRSGRVLYASTGSTKLLGVCPEQLQEDPWSWIGHVAEEDRVGVRAAVTEFLAAADDHLTLEYRLMPPGEPARWLRDTLLAPAGAIPEIVFRIVQDTTQERLLRAAEERFHGFVNAIPDLFFRVDADGRFLDCVNPGQLPLLAMSEAAVVGKLIEDLLPPGLAILARRALEAVMQGSPLEIIEYELPFQDQTHHFEARLCPDAGQACILVRDITDTRRSSERYLEVCEGERRRIGEDLHDGVSQQLVALSFRAHALEQRLDPQSRDAFRTLREDLEVVTRQVRSIAHGLHPVEVDALGLNLALEELAAGMSRTYRVACVTDLRGMEIREPTVATQIYRIVQEAVSNAVRHAAPKHVRIALIHDDAAVELMVEDDGRGIDENKGTSTGIGLETMRQRARRLGGMLKLEAVPTGGTRVICRFLIRTTKGQET
ncbi:MAG: PAS domain-containing protein [Candidatus Eisenbacteria bacterium]